MRNEGLEPKEWSGWGIEEAEGLWLGILGGDNIEVCFAFLMTTRDGLLTSN